MSSRSDRHGDEAYREPENEDRGGFPYYTSWSWGGVWPFATSREAGTRYDEETYEGAGDSPYDEDEGESRWDESLITLLIVGGAVLFLFPEPVTSGVGILLLSMGVIGWLIDWALS